MKVYLVGLPGCGKSVLGKKLSESMYLPFMDLDAELEKKEGLKISDIFIDKGEHYFRNIEAETLRQLSISKEFVMATGGGAPCFYNNMDFINQTGTSIFIDTPIETIVERINPQEKQARPLLGDVSDDQLRQKLEDLRKTRIGYYQQAHFTINGSIVTAIDVLRILNAQKL